MFIIRFENPKFTCELVLRVFEFSIFEEKEKDNKYLYVLYSSLEHTKSNYTEVANT